MIHTENEVNNELIKLATLFLNTSQYILHFKSSEKYNINHECPHTFNDNKHNLTNSNSYEYIKSPNELYTLMNIISKLEGDGFYIVSKFSYYPINGYSEWLTDDNKYIFLSYSPEENKSGINYYDDKNNKLQTIYNKKGWNINKILNPKKNCWYYFFSNTHCLNIVFKQSNTHFLKNKIHNYVNLFDKRGKTCDSFYNFLRARHGCYSNEESRDNRDWRVNNKTAVLHLILLDFIFMDDTYYTKNILLENISWKCKDDISLKDYKLVDTSIPVILVETYENPHHLKYRAVDGSHRLSKLLSLDNKNVSAYVIDNIIFNKMLIYTSPRASKNNRLIY